MCISIESFIPYLSIGIASFRGRFAAAVAVAGKGKNPVHGYLLASS